MNQLPSMARPICGLHVRRGAAIKENRAYQHIQAYLDVLEEAMPLESCATLYLASDDVLTVRSELVEALRG